LLSLGIVFLSTQLKSRAMLVWGTIFFMAYLIKISAEYFADSVGWPAALIISGLAMIAVGYYAFRIKKQYIG
jgi:membrane-bound ClpP family serine protease